MSASAPAQVIADYPHLPGSNAFVRTLQTSDLRQCVRVESAFPEEERCSAEKFQYRLTECSDLCLGLFVVGSDTSPSKDKHDTLVAHVITTRIAKPVVTEESMGITGNDPKGTYAAVHSLAVSPDYQGKGIGRTLMRMYIDYVTEQKERLGLSGIAIIAHGNLIKFYESLGFKNEGESECQFGGGGWYDMAFMF